MVNVQYRILPLKVIELLRDPLHLLGFVQIFHLEMWVLDIAIQRGMDKLIDFLVV